MCKTHVKNCIKIQRGPNIFHSFFSERVQMTYTQNHLEWSMSIITQIFMPMNWTILLMMKLVLLQNPFIMAEGKSPKKNKYRKVGVESNWNSFEIRPIRTLVIRLIWKGKKCSKNSMKINSKFVRFDSKIYNSIDSKGEK